MLTCGWGCCCAEATHDFCQRGVDWGFTTFMQLRDVLDKSKGFLKDDKLEVCSD